MGGRVLNLMDLSDVYMTFDLPTKEAGQATIALRRASCWAPSLNFTRRHMNLRQ